MGDVTNPTAASIVEDSDSDDEEGELEHREKDGSPTRASNVKVINPPAANTLATAVVHSRTKKLINGTQTTPNIPAPPAELYVTEPGSQKNKSTVLAGNF